MTRNDAFRAAFAVAQAVYPRRKGTVTPWRLLTPKTVPLALVWCREIPGVSPGELS